MLIQALSLPKRLLSHDDHSQNVSVTSGNSVKNARFDKFSKKSFVFIDKMGKLFLSVKIRIIKYKGIFSIISGI